MKRFGVPTYFLTWTCGQKRFPGVAKVYNAILAKKLDVEYSATHLQRVWDRVNNLFVRFLCEDPSHAIGKVQHYFLRKEFQPDVGNFYHVHMLVWTDDDVGSCDVGVRQDAFMIALSRITATICGSFKNVVPPENEKGWRQPVA